MGEARTSSVLTGWTGTMLRALADRGVDVEELVTDVGIDPAVLADPERRIPLEASTALWNAAERITGDDAFGIDVSRYVIAGTFHGLGQAFMTSTSLRAALHRVARFCRVTADASVVSTEVEGDELVYVNAWRPGETRPAEMAIVATLAAILRGARSALGRSFTPTAAEFRHPRPRNLARFEQFFGCELRFDAPDHVLRFRLADADRPWTGAHERLATMSDAAVEAYLATLPDRERHTLVSDAVGSIVADVIAAGEPDIHAVASELVMSVRTLQRRLAEDGTSFRDVVASTRQEIGERLLREPTLSVNDVGRRLGFSETAAFSRAFRRWTGESPATWRREHTPRR